MALIAVDPRVTGMTVPKMDVVESIEQMTLIAAVAISAGDLVAVDGTGRFVKSAIATADDADKVYGMATSTVAAGQAVTAINKGTVAGHNITDNYGTLVFAEAAGALANAANGTIRKAVGRVVPLRSTVPFPGSTTYLKAIHISL
jgi:plastocyanin